MKKWSEIKGSFSAKSAFKIAAAPVLLSAALVSDMPLPPPDAAPIWSHEPTARLDLNRDLNSSVSPATLRAAYAGCVTPVSRERFTLLPRNDGGWNGFYRLQHNGGSFAKGLYDFAQTNKIYACMTPQAHRIRAYDAAAEAVTMHSQSSTGAQMAEMVHGLAHARMNHLGLSQHSRDEGLFSRLHRRVMVEAIAQVAEYTAAAELRANGDNTMISAFTANHPGFTYFEAALKRAQIAESGNGRRAMQRAAGDTISHLIRDGAFIAHVGEDVMRTYIAEMETNERKPASAHYFRSGDVRDLGLLQRGHSLTEFVRPLGLQELTAANAHVAMMVEGIERARARDLRYTPYVDAVRGNPYRNLKADFISRQMRISGNRYTAHQALERARYQTQFNYSWRNKSDEPFFDRAIQVDYARHQVPASLLPLWQNMQNLRSYSPTIGNAMMDHAVRANIIVCYGRMPESVAGQWRSGFGVLSISDRLTDNPPRVTAFQAHELLHMMQQSHSQLRHSNSRLGLDSQLDLLTREGAARVTEYLLAIEMRENGSDTLWESVSGAKAAQAADEAYRAAREEGKDMKTALQAGGRAGYYAMFQTQGWLNHYNGTALDGFLRSILWRGRQAPDAQSQFTLDIARSSGYVTQDFNFLATIDRIPQGNELFGDNVHMRQAFEYGQMEHLGRTLGRHSERYKQQRARLVADNNPYINVNLNRVIDQLNSKGETRSILELMNCEAGIGICKPKNAHSDPVPRPKGVASHHICTIPGA